MKMLPYKVFILLMLLCQIGWILMPDLNTVSDSYRYEQRWATYTNWVVQKTPESKAIFDHERRVFYVHRQNRAYLIFTVFLIVDGVVIYFLWNRGHRKMTA
jgi:hypothetical protein